MSAKERDARQRKRLLALKKGTKKRPKTQAQIKNIKRAQTQKARQIKENKIQKLITDDFKKGKFKLPKRFNATKYRTTITKYEGMNTQQLNSQLRKRGLIQSRKPKIVRKPRRKPFRKKRRDTFLMKDFIKKRKR
jgi:hypothetical protein